MIKLLLLASLSWGLGADNANISTGLRATETCVDGSVAFGSGGSAFTCASGNLTVKSGGDILLSGSGGLIGIGDATPDATMEVVQDASNNFALKITSANGTTDILGVLGSGLVEVAGPSQTISTAALHVNGAAVIDGNLVQKTLKSCSTGTQTDANGLFSACVASDEKLKANIHTLEMEPGAVDNLTPRTWTWKDSGRGSGTQVGFVAQEVGKVLPEAVVSAGEGLKGLAPQSLDAIEVLEIQDLRRRVRELEIKCH